MSQFLTEKGYQVFGLVRGQNNPKTKLVSDENPSLELVEGVARRVDLHRALRTAERHVDKGALICHQRGERLHF